MFILMIPEHLRQECLCLRGHARISFGEFFVLLSLCRSPNCWGASPRVITGQLMEAGEEILLQPCFNHHHWHQPSFLPAHAASCGWSQDRDQTRDQPQSKAANKNTFQQSPCEVSFGTASPVPSPHLMQHPSCRDSWWGQETRSHPQHLPGWPYSLCGQTIYDGMQKSKEKNKKNN